VFLKKFTGIVPWLHYLRIGSVWHQLERVIEFSDWMIRELPHHRPMLVFEWYNLIPQVRHESSS
jgi:hypothetical protein